MLRGGVHAPVRTEGDTVAREAVDVDDVACHRVLAHVTYRLACSDADSQHVHVQGLAPTLGVSLCQARVG